MNALTHSIRATHRALLSAAAIAAVSTVAVTAQETSTRKMQDPTSGSYTSTDHIVGAKVKLSPDAEAKAKAAREGEQADAPTATATDWLIDAQDGSVDYAVVSIGGFLGIGDKTVLVPAGDMRWNDATEQFTLDWTAQQLEARTPFDLNKACESGLDAATKANATPPKNGEPMRKDEARTADASTKPSGKVAGTEFMTSNCRLCKASELSTLPVHARSEDFGKVSDLIVDRGQHRIVLAVVDHGGTLGMGGTSYLVPFAKLTPCAKSGDSAGEVNLLCAASHTKDELSKSVVYEKPANGAVDPVAAKQALSTGDRQKPTGDHQNHQK